MAKKARIMAFVEDLTDAEETMPENAAMAFTCGNYGIEIDAGYDWLMKASSYPELKNNPHHGAMTAGKKPR